MNCYITLNNQVYTNASYSLVPIRQEDRFDIMNWRNEQMYHLRQNELLTKEKQDAYFNEVVRKLFEQSQPSQILFSFLKNNKCIGYGGLVHINWIDKNAEISFIMETALEKNFFALHWSAFLKLIERVALNLKLHKIFTYAFDLRPHLYEILEKNQYRREAVLDEHCYFDEKYINVVIHSKIMNKPTLRKAKKSDVELTFKWVNDSQIRAFSYNQGTVLKKDHIQWFYSKLETQDCEYYILEKDGKGVGSLRFDISQEKEAKISYLIDPQHAGQGLGTIILDQGIHLLRKNRPEIQKVFGYVLNSNKASIRIFEKLHFDLINKDKSESKFEKQIL